MIAITPLFEEGMISNALKKAKGLFSKGPKPEGSAHQRYTDAARKAAGPDPDRVGGVGGVMNRIVANRDRLKQAAGMGMD